MTWKEAQKEAEDRFEELNLDPDHIKGEVIPIQSYPNNHPDRIVNQALARKLRKLGARVVYQNFN